MDDGAVKEIPNCKYLDSIFTEDAKNEEDVIQGTTEAKLMCKPLTPKDL
jgi:hypothetical protein